MATIDNKGRIRGTAGAVVYRMYRGKNIVQGKPRKFKQTEDSIRASTEFGLASSTAAVIRRAFEEAYIHRDGEAASRSTQQVYKSLLNSRTSGARQRDLHDADLSILRGMEFNKNSILADLIPLSNAYSELTPNGLRITLKNIGPLSVLRKPAEISRDTSLYRIRLVLVGFNFRKEYFEYLGVQDIDLRRREGINERVVNFDCGQRPDLLMMVSMSVLAYKETNMRGELLLLNSKQFSPCAIIAAFHAEDPGSFPDEVVQPDLSDSPEYRSGSLNIMGYEGNRLLLDLPRKLRNSRKSWRPEKTGTLQTHGMVVGRRVSFT